jgi:hypothetical protein
MRAIYLRSVRDDVEKPGKFKLKYKSSVPDVNVFSQMPHLDTTESDDDMVRGQIIFFLLQRVLTLSPVNLVAR